MATAQLNARIKAQIKAAGDQALSQAGYSPTQAIRLLWSYAAEHWHDIAAINKLFDLLKGESESSLSDQTSLRVRRAQEGPLIFVDACAEMGVSEHAINAISKLTDEDLLEQARLDKLEERGLLL